ncbi:Uncharacterised protein [uncultured Clostridium sp.]|nr:LPXTG cell wall anchor domain-containing protein [uncultured Clostridium sp.]SCK04209.1 Uncharacterised protein [uncultured Clostridium sp.]
MYLPESKNVFGFFITYDLTDIILLALVIIAVIGFVIYRKKRK